MNQSPLSDIQLSREPASTVFFNYTYPGTKEAYLHELLSRTCGPNNNPLWKLNQQFGDRPSESDDEKSSIINASLESIRKKFGTRSFSRTSRSFQFRCGQYIDNPIIDINSTYILLQLNESLNRFNEKLQFFSQSKRVVPLSNRIQNIFLLLANDGQAILIMELVHKTRTLTQLIDDIHPFQTNINNCVVSLKTYIPEEHYKPENQPSLDNWGYLKQYIGQTTKPLQDDALCPLLHFFGWLVFADWDAPANSNHFDTERYNRYLRLKTHHTLYRMHDLLISHKDWDDHRDGITYYINRGSKLEQSEFQSYPQEYQFTKSYFRNWNHMWTVSRDSVVSIMHHNPDTIYNFTTERFWKGYQILTLQVLIEYIGCMHFNYQIGKIAYQEKDKDKLTHLIKNMHQFRLGINLVDFSQRASEAEYYDTLRKVFNINRLIDELSNEVKDVLEIISMIQAEENEERREAEQIAREQQREDDRQRRENQKQLDDERYKEKKRQKEHLQQLAEQQRAQAEERQKQQDTLLSLIGATTIPFALISGLMGMNTNTTVLPKDATKENLATCGHDLGLVPCLTFWEVIGLCGLLGIIIFFSYRYILRRN